MAASAPSRVRRGVLIGAVLTASSALVLPTTAMAQPTAHGWHRRACPAAETIVKKIKFTHRVLAPGIVESGGQMKDKQGTVVVHTLRVDLSRKTTAVQPLVHHLTTTGTLSYLAKGHHHLVAVSNLGYFDWGQTDAPYGALIAHGLPAVASTTPEQVVGFTAKHTIESSKVSLDGRVTVGTGSAAVSRSIVDLNEVYMRAGIGLYTSQWGSGPTKWNPGNWRVPEAQDGSTFARAVIDGKLGPSDGLTTSVPANGSLLVAKGQSAENWLSNLPTGWKVTSSLAVKTTASTPYVQAYGVGVTLVARHGLAKTGFTCDSSNRSQPARTGIGFLNKGKTMILAFVSEKPDTTQHGLDNDQMSALMEQLGADHAYNLDGSGSTELLARHPGGVLKGQNYLADGDQRQMPVGLGIDYIPAKAKAAHAKPKQKATKKK